jgi:photoactive yellow protein
MAVQRIEVDADSIAAEIGNLTAADLDALPFGAIQLDRTGKVLMYNRTEEQISGRKRLDVINKNFFTEVAPCTRVRRFYGVFQDGVERRSMNEVFDFTFRFPEGAREVRIRLIYAEAPQPSVWIFVTPISL